MKLSKDILKPALVLVAIAAITSGALVLTNHFTAPIIEARAEEAELESLQIVMPEAASFSEAQTLDIAADSDSGLPEGTYTYYEAYDANGDKVGIVATGNAPGYGDVVSFTAGVNGEGLITGIRQLQLNETPGIGMRAAEPEFQEQFIGKTGPLVMNGGDGPNEVDGLSGATVTSNAVNIALNQVLTIANENYDGALFTPAGPNSGSEQLTAVVPDAASFSERMRLTLTEGQVADTPAGDYHYYLAYDENEEPMAVVIVSSGSGYAGDVTVMTGYDAAMTLTGLAPLDHGETPGFGAKIDDESEQVKFQGLTAPLTLAENYDGISEATETSRGLVEAVNRGAGIADLVLNQGVEGEPDPESDQTGDAATFKFFASVEDLAAVTPEGLTEGEPQAIDMSAYDVETTADSYLFYALSSGDTPEAVAVVTEDKGFAGDLVMITAINADGTIAKTHFVQMNESDGYGKVADDAEWLTRFEGLSGSVTAGTDFDGISNATITTDAVTRSMNDALTVANVLFNEDGFAAATPADPDATPEDPTVTPEPTDPTDPDGGSEATPADPDSWSGPTPEDDGRNWPDADGGATPEDPTPPETDDEPSESEPARPGDVTPATEAEVTAALSEMVGIDAASLSAQTVTLASGDAGAAPADTYIYYALEDGQFAILTWSAEGFIGSVQVLTVVNADGSIEAVRPMAHKDTPEIGGQVEDADYLDQFKGRTDADADTISGATVTSSAVNEAVGFALDVAAYLEGGQA